MENCFRTREELNKTNGWKIDYMIKSASEFTDRSRASMLDEIRKSEEVFDTIAIVKDTKVLASTRLVGQPLHGVLLIFV